MKIRILAGSRFVNSKSLISGFTLIELLVVLAIVGATGALVAPNMWNSYQRASERQQLQNFVNELMVLRRQAHFSAASLQIAENTYVSGRAGDQLPALPPGWLANSQTDIFFLPSGVTNGGSMTFSSPTGRDWELLIQPLDGAVTILSQ